MSTFDLFSSVRDGNADIVRRLLQYKARRQHLNDRNEWGDTALHLSAEAGNGEICQMLTAAGASATVRNNRGETCLHRAAVGGHVEAVSAIVGRDQDPEAVNSQNDAGYTALHHAAKHGSRELIDILVKAGADQMIENNAGETPYMVAHKYQQWDAERLLLNAERQHADKATREMNRIEKKIVRGYLNAVKLASQLESRVRIVLVGDTGSGKTSLKKTLSGEAYDPAEKPSSGMNADPSVTRVTFKQFKEWVQQPSSKADPLRLNLEYIDVIIDYILYFVRRPQIVSDDHMDPNALQIEKERPKTVQFNPDDDVIPLSEDEQEWEEQEPELSVSSGDSTTNTGPSQGESNGGGGSGGYAVVEGSVDIGAPRTEGDVVKDGVGRPAGSRNGGGGEGKEASSSDLSTEAGYVNEVTPKPEILDEPDSCISAYDIEEGQYFSAVSAEDEDFNNEDDDRLHRLALDSKTASLPGSFSSTSNPEDSPASTRPRSGSLTSPPSVQSPKREARPSSANPGSETGANTSQQQQQQQQEQSTEEPTGKQLDGTSALLFHQTRRELSRLLVEKIPMEILKRMVIRWPVGDEHYQDRSSLNAKRLAITIWDTSGDPLQANYMPFFFSERCIFVTAFNLFKNLDDVCVSHQKQNLLNIDGTMPSNAEVLEAWLGVAVAFTKRTPSEPFRCTNRTPLLPPVILACTHSDHPSLEDSPVLFHRFFDRKSFDSYKKHLVEARNPSAVRLSNRAETLNNKSEVDLEEHYSGHHLLRREIEYLARQLPYVQENIPVQWVKFEQLIYGLQQQKKLLLLYGDLARYIGEHCNLSGSLKILPVLSHFHDLGVIVHFYRHPELSGLIITRPQWLVSALGSIITSSPSRWVNQEVQSGFKKLAVLGSIQKEMLLLAYRCARMGHKYWNEMLFIMNCMDLLTCHPSLHESKSVYMPAMVTLPPPRPYITEREGDPLPVYFDTSGGSALPVALFNQLLVRCIRSSQYNPVLYYKLGHFKLNSTHHLLLWLEQTTIGCLVQPNTDKFCEHCNEKSTKFSLEPECSSIEHLIGPDVELMPTDNLSTLIRNSTNSGVIENVHLSFTDDFSLMQLCPAVLEFLAEHLQFLCRCWFPGLDLWLSSHVDGEVTVLDEFWKYTVLKKEVVVDKWGSVSHCEGKVDQRLAVWFSC